MIHNIVGFLMVAAGIFLTAAGFPLPAFPLAFVGAILFVTLLDRKRFVDFCTDDESGTYTITSHERHYGIPLIFFGLIKAIYKVDYYKCEFMQHQLEEPETIEWTKISRAEYKALVTRQIQLHKANVVNEDIVRDFCTPDETQTARRKTIITATWVFLLLSLTMLVEPVGYFLTPIYAVPLGLFLIVKTKEQKYAKIKDKAYELLQYRTQKSVYTEEKN